MYEDSYGTSEILTIIVAIVTSAIFFIKSTLRHYQNNDAFLHILVIFVYVVNN